VKHHLPIPPSIEKRLQVWTDWAERQKHSPITSYPCITLSREYGCQAYKLAETLIQKLNAYLPEGEEWSVLDRYLLEKIAQNSGYSEAELNYLTLTSPGFQSMMANLSGPVAVNPSKAFTFIKETIRSYAKTGNCIIVGRGGVCITQDLPRVLHVRLVAPLDFKVGHIMKSMNLTKEAAKAIIRDRQGERNAFILHFTKLNNTDPGLYHLILNNDKSSIPEMAETIHARVLALMEPLQDGSLRNPV